ncbi:MAG: SufD family Fe-S cluster assembly protein [Bacilli bacterium]|nr:SufD family Fe-S cluster assembly protein [Bacilli bacterium]
MKLNELRSKTTNGFKVNNLDIELDLNELNTDKLYDINGIEISQIIKNEEITSKVGLTYSKYLELTITVDKVYDKPILVNYNFENNDSLVSKVIINYKKASSCDFIFNYKSLDNNKHFNYLVEEINTEDYSTGSITYINNLNDFSTNIMSFNDNVLEESTITHNLIDIGGSIRIYNSVLNSIGYKSKNYFNNIYLGRNNELIDINYDLKNIGKSSINNLKVEGCLKDNSKKVFRGIIDFVEGCTKSDGQENENCILLSDTCISRSVPILLCHEDDVIGAHGESSGKINEDKLFYLMSRGLSYEESTKLIVVSNFNSIINEIPDESIKEEILEIVEKRV